MNSNISLTNTCKITRSLKADLVPGTNPHGICKSCKLPTSNQSSPPLKQDLPTHLPYCGLGDAIVIIYSWKVIAGNYLRNITAVSEILGCRISCQKTVFFLWWALHTFESKETVCMQLYFCFLMLFFINSENEKSPMYLEQTGQQLFFFCYGCYSSVSVLGRTRSEFLGSHRIVFVFSHLHFHPKNLCKLDPLRA